MTRPAPDQSREKQGEEFPDQADAISRASANWHQPVRRRRSHRRLVLYKAALGLLTVLFAVVAILYTFQITGIQTRNKALKTELRTKQHELEAITNELALAKKRLAAIAQGRIPDLYPLTLDQATQFEAGIVHNVIFSLTGVGAEMSYEYRLVLRNNSGDMLEPNVRILLFDELGIQVGSAQVPAEEKSANSGTGTLKHEETRSYIGAIPQIRSNPPKYFLVIDKSIEDLR